MRNGALRWRWRWRCVQCDPGRGGREVDLFELSLEQLSDSASRPCRAPSRVGDLAAAACVVTGEEIIGSGVTRSPRRCAWCPASRSRISSNHWAISARGFSERFANKLLVLVDGRSIYTPLFSGVMWESQDLMPEDVERIEVIRGPGAALWVRTRSTASSTSSPVAPPIPRGPW